MYTLYYLLFATLITLTLPLWIWRYLRTPKYRDTVLQRLGYKRPTLPSGSRIWVHAVSVGEVMAVKGLIQQLQQQFPHDHIILSTVTKTGQKVAQENLPEIQTRFYLPVDLPWIVKQVTETIKPRCLIVMETELWPGLFHSMAHHHIPVILVNGRLSPSSSRNYRKFSLVMKRFLDPVHLFAMQSEMDAERMAKIGADPERILVTGNIKYDQAMQLPTTAHMAQLAQRFPKPPQGKIWMAASTHPGEEEVICSTFTQLRKNQPDLQLILVPRHPERCQQVTTLIKKHGLTPVLFSETQQASCNPNQNGPNQNGPKPWHNSVMLVDEVGWLTRLYGYADIAFIGGSLIPHGGQNMLEAAAWGIPTLFGRHTFNFKDVTTQLLDGQAALQIQQPEQLTATMQTLLNDDKRCKTMGKQARSVVANNVGALQRTLQAIQTIVPPTPSPIHPRQTKNSPK